MGEDQQESEAPSGDVFEVTVRVGTADRTAGYAGVARIEGAPFRWVAEFTDKGLNIDPRPTEGGTWDGEARQWVLADGTTISDGAVHALLEGLGHVLQAGTIAAGVAAERAYEHAIIEAFGELTTQRALFL